MADARELGDECRTSRTLKGAVAWTELYKHLDSADVPWVGGGGARAHSCVHVRVRVRVHAGVCVLSDGEAHDLAASLYCHSVHSSHPVRGTSRGRMRRVRAHRSIATTAASEFTADTSAEPYSMCATGELRNAALSARNKGPYRTLVRSRGPPRRRVEEATRCERPPRLEALPKSRQ